MPIFDSLKELAIQALIPVVATCLFCLLNKYTPFKLLPNRIKKSEFRDKSKFWKWMLKQVIFGVVFGLIAMSCNVWGIKYQGAIANTRDASPIAAGLIFGGPAGVIAGLMGGIHRMFLGGYTVVACSVSTILSGIYSAYIKEKLLDNHRPSWGVSFFAGIVMEVFHLSMVFLTHVNDEETAVNIVQVLTLPIVLFTSVSILLSRICATFLSGERLGFKNRRRHIATILQRRLLALVTIAFVLTSACLYFVQTNIYDTQCEKQLLNEITDLDALYNISIQSRESDEKISYDEAVSIYKKRISERSVEGGGLCLTDSEGRFQIGGTVYELSDFVKRKDGEFSSQKMLRVKLDETSYLMCFRKSRTQAYVISYFKTESAYSNRNITMYINAFFEVLVFAALYVLLFFTIKKNITDNVYHINENLKDISEGDLDTVVDVRNNLEFDELSDRINTTVGSLKGYIDAEKERIESDLTMAHVIQTSSLPNIFPAFPDHKEFDIYAYMVTAKEVGGDFYDFYLSDDTHLCFEVCDVSGKGIPAAMFMMRAKTIIKSLATRNMPVGDIFYNANNTLTEGNESNMFVTAWLGKINTDTGHVNFANAGHNPPLIKRAGGEFEYLKSRVGLVLAGMEGAPYKTQELVLGAGDIIFAYTDGVTEATNADKQLYGEDRLKNLLNNCEFANMEELCKKVKEDVDAFVGDEPQFDDITMLAYQYNGFKNKQFVYEKAAIADIDEITEVTDEFLTELGMPKKTQMQIFIAIDEIYSNIVQYAYPKDEPGYAEIKIEEMKKENGVIITFTDEGIPYNPLKKKDPNIHLSAEEREIGGLGIYMVKETMDDMVYEYRDNKNILKLYKKY